MSLHYILLHRPSRRVIVRYTLSGILLQSPSCYGGLLAGALSPFWFIGLLCQLLLCNTIVDFLIGFLSFTIDDSLFVEHIAILQ